MAKKKEKSNGVHPKHTQAYERLSFLHQAAMLMSSIQYEIPNKDKMDIDESKEHLVKNWQGDPEGTLLGPARYFNNNMKQITSKLVLRLDPSIKRMICKRCETPVIPLKTNKIRVQSRFIVYTCKICKAKRRYSTQNPNYQLFTEKEDVVIAADDNEKDQ